MREGQAGAYQEKEEWRLLLWKLWQLIVDLSDSGLHGLECPGQTMILIFWIVHRFSMICQLEGLQKYSLPSTTNNTIWGIIWLTESTQIGIYLSRQFQSHKVQSGVIYQCMRRHSARTSSEHLEFYRSGEGFLYFHVNFGQRAQSTV